MGFFVVVYIFSQGERRVAELLTDASGSGFALQSSIVLHHDVPIMPSWFPVLLGPVSRCFLFPSFCLKGVVNWITVRVVCLIPRSQKAGKS